MKLLTNLIFEPKGRHDPNLAYNIKDTVMNAAGNRVYFALQDVPAGIELENEEYWILQIDLSEVTGGGAVASVNGKTGVVVLSAADVGALPEDTEIPTVPTKVSAFQNDADYAKKSEIPDTSAFVTKAVSDLTNYYTKSQTYTRTEINQKISAIPKFSISVVSALPSTGISATTIYLVPGGADNNLYTEYIYVNNAWEILGSQRIDLTGYATETYVGQQLSGYQPKGNYALKSELPMKLSELSEDSTHRVVTDTEKAAWNGKSNFSGNYADLNGKPTIPTVPTKVSAFENDKGYLTQHQDISGKLDASELPEAIDTALAQAKASGEFDGADGDDGVSPTLTVSSITGGHRITIADAKGTKTVDVMDGSNGDAGRGISSIARTSGNGAAGTTDTYTITYTDGTKTTFGVYNGKNGTNGTSVTVQSVTESSEDGGENVVVFSDGKTLTVKNGKKGSSGASGGGEVVPDYVVTEAMSVLDKAVSAQGARTFTFAAITDMHYGSSDYIDGVIHACQGMRHISERIKLDAVAVLGDFTDEHQMDTETAVTDLEEMNALLDPLRVNVNLRVKGNHDNRPNAAAQTYRYIMAYSDATVWGSRIGGYFYREFPEYKIRVICLNTTEVARDNLSVSPEQCQWFADSLNLSAKADADEWGILILSHHPLDWTVSDGNYRFGPIINAYQTGKSWTDGTVSCDFTAKNDALIIANIHGHIHNLLVDKIYSGEPGNSTQTNVWRLATAASRVDYINHYSGIWVEDRWDSKVQNTAKDTAFCLYCIDLDTRIIKSFCYGAGYDREVEYSGKMPSIINLIDTVGYTDNKRYSASSHGGKDATGYTMTGEIEIAQGDVLRTKDVNFDAAEYQYCNIACIPKSNPTSDWTLVTNSSGGSNGENYLQWTIDANNNLTITGGSMVHNIKIRLTGYGSGANLIVTKNQVIS